MLLLASLLAACGCGERSVRERCDDVEARLTAELAALPTGCRRDADCQPVQLSCGRLHLTSAEELPPEVNGLAERHEQLDCCQPSFDATVPLDLPALACQEPAEGGAARCALSCDDVAAQVQARRDDLAQECDFATDCRAVRLPCGRYGVTSERGSLQALDSLVVWHDEYGCCDAAFDPAAIPAAPSTLHCTEAGACSLTP